MGISSLLQIDAPVVPGHTGGALINIKGFVVDIITSLEVIQPYLQNNMTVPEDVHWAVKSDYLRLLINPPTPQEKQ
jgi:S1-C subfamily serine protease